MQILEIFKVPIYETQLDLDVDKLIELVVSHAKKNDGRVVSNMGGYQSNGILLNQPSLTDLKEQIHKHVNLFAKEIINQDKLCVEQVWFNINNYKDCNLLHSHACSTISGCYYLQTPEDCGYLKFVNPAADVMSFYNTQQEIEVLNTFTSSEWEFKPAANTFYLFPSWLNHYVTANNNKNKSRISIAFNSSEGYIE